MQQRNPGAECERGEPVYVIKSRMCLLAGGKDESVNKGTGDGGRGEMKRCEMVGWGGQTIRRMEGGIDG